MIIVVRDGQVVHPHALNVIIDLVCGFGGLKLLSFEDVVRRRGLVIHLIHISVHVGNVVVHVDNFIILLCSPIVVASDIVNDRHDVVDINDLAGLTRIGGPCLEPAIPDVHLLDGTRG